MESSNYFQETPSYIPPDYETEEEDIGGPTEDDDYDDDDFSDIDEGEEETKIDRELSSDESSKKEVEEKINMVASPFGESTNTNNNNSSSWGSSPGWGNSGGNNNPWAQNNSSPWGSTNKPSWGGNPWSGNNSGGNKQEIDRNKDVIFIDFLDCVVETYSSNGQPGLLPRDIYDLKPRFDVWAKLGAFNPVQVYMIIPRNLLPNTNGGGVAIQATMDYFCCALSSFLRIPYMNCQCLIENRIGQPKEELMSSIIKTLPIGKEKIVSIGLYSGVQGMSNKDLLAAQNCGIEHIDLGNLLNNMY